MISSENSEENQDELQNEEETQNKHPILKYVDETPPFEEFFAKCPDIINHIKDNYTSDPPESTLGLVTLLDRYMLNVENKTLTVFLTQKLLKHKVIQVLTEVWDHFWAQNYLTSDKPEAEDWRSLLEAILSVFTDISDVSADGAKDIVAVGSLERFLAALGPDKICVSTAETNEYVKFFGENNLTSIYNCLRWDTTTTNNAKPIFRANSGIEKMIKIKDEIKERKLESFEPWMVNVLLAMAYTLEENEENLLDEETKSDLIAFLRDHACDAIKVPERRSDGMSLSEYIEAINVLLASDKCKEELCRDSTLFDCLSQAIPTNDTDDPELIALVRCLYLLTFIEEGKKKLTENAPLKSGTLKTSIIVK